MSKIAEEVRERIINFQRCLTSCILTKENKLVSITETITLIEETTNFHEENCEQVMIDACRSINLVELLSYFETSDPFIRYLLVKLLANLFKEYPILFEDVSRNVHSLLNCSNAFLRVILEKARRWCKNDDQDNFDQIYVPFLNECCKHLENLVHNLASEDLQEKNSATLDIFHGVLLSLKIFNKLQEELIEQSKRCSMALIQESQKLVLKILQDESWFSQISPYMWTVISKILLQVVKTDYLNDIDLAPIQSTCNDIAMELTKPQMQNKIIVLKATFCGESVNGNEANSDVLRLNECSARKLIIFVMKTSYIFCCKGRNEEEIHLLLMKVFNILHKFPSLHVGNTDQISLLLDVFMEQDNELTDAIFMLLKIFVEISKSPSTSKFCRNSRRFIDPFRIFHVLTRQLAYDDTVFLDWLVSSESNFRNYFQLFLHEVKDRFSLFVQSLQSNSCVFLKSMSDPDTCDVETPFHRLNIDEKEEQINISLVDYSSSEEEDSETVILKHIIPQSLDDVMSCLIRLNLKLNKLNHQGLLSDNLYGIIDLLDAVEEEYEAQEY